MTKNSKKNSVAVVENSKPVKAAKAKTPKVEKVTLESLGAEKPKKGRKAPKETAPVVPPTNPNTPPVPVGADGRVAGRETVFGQSLVKVARWMGANDWKFANARAAFNQLGVHIEDVTIRIQLSAGKTGSRGPAAEITEAQAKELVKAGTVVAK